eukprot:8843613-Alexandrium_andersonii.AAC.1
MGTQLAHRNDNAGRPTPDQPIGFGGLSGPPRVCADAKNSTQTMWCMRLGTGATPNLFVLKWGQGAATWVAGAGHGEPLE